VAGFDQVLQEHGVHDGARPQQRLRAGVHVAVVGQPEQAD
jgi:hypothetical protein